MIEHHIQKKIIADLVEHETARYADLKPAELDGNTFTYHLRALLQQKFIIKNEQGKYELTNKGKLYGINSSLTKKDILRQAHSIILLSIRSDEDKWLLRKRAVQPMYGKIGFIHGEPVAGKTIYEAAAETLKRRTNLEGNFAVKGSGYVCLHENAELLAYSHFTLLEVTNLEGTLKTADSHGENIWLENPDFTREDMIPSMEEIARDIDKPGIFFLDLFYKFK